MQTSIQQRTVAKPKRKSKRSRGFREYLNACATKTTSALLTRRQALRPQIADAMSELGAIETELNRRSGGISISLPIATNPDDDL
jgi:hypothetical protein